MNETGKTNEKLDRVAARRGKKKIGILVPNDRGTLVMHVELDMEAELL
jgi:hypothetical protein